MYRSLKERFWWPGMKKDVAQYVARCLTCQRIKAEHQRPGRELQPLEIPEWKWEQIVMDFVIGLPRTSKGYDSIWVIIDRLTKSAHFLPVKVTYTGDQLAEAYVQEIETIGMVPYEALYGRKCRSPIHWHEVGERKYIEQQTGPDMVTSTTEVVRKIQQKIATAQSRQKCYADKRRRPLEFQVGEKVFLRITPMKGVMRFGQKGKLNPRFIGPFEILDRIGKVAYKLALPPKLSDVHDVFHVFMLKKYIPDSSHVLKHEVIQVDKDLTYEEKPIQIMDRKNKVLRNKEIPLVKVLWRSQTIEEATWEREDEMKAKYPELF
ncbi:uncharacterized protein LOC133814194 [Humulus lupulus]|uniref:uncharacterized protein LOC133814194 n=1 Tax=Humulus lupulus TaxID=3486 RepID=UPI002B404442|nr:uncharacterized protein LOC133814194 [Humulus lupulus]